MDENEKIDGFKFAVTLLTALGTIIYVLYAYFHNNAVDNNLYTSSLGLITILLISALLLIAYISVKGFSAEVKDNNQKENLEKLASNIYLIAFLMGFIASIYIISFFLLTITGYRYNQNEPIFIVMTFIILFFGYVGFSKFIMKSQLEFPLTKMKSILIFALLFVLFFTLWSASYTAILGLMQGDVIDNMDCIYYKNGEPIPVSIEVIGQNPDLSIYLYNVSSEIDNITLKPTHDSNKVESGKYLVGNAFDSGKYFVFINITNPNMTEGYYELIYSRSINGRSIDKHGKSFYLLNKTEV
ncbi:MAG: hypothetical protein KKG76_10515 [Euryarchaeota archaeon]|nr:hypothetical protein [Euryarchaeota archaeon]